MIKSNNKRLARNTGVLYFRMIITLIISLYTSRVVLHVLGIEDFGVYNVVAGVVTMFNFLSGAMAVGTQRFMSFELAGGTEKSLKQVFSMSINIHIIIVFFVLVLSETIGLWVLNNYLKIPEERIFAANCVYQFTILSFVVTVLSVPYNALIIAYERMNIFAYISIAEVILKLLTVFVLDWVEYDKLILFGLLTFGATFVSKLGYVFYSYYAFKKCQYIRFWDRILFKKLLNYNGWNLWGNIASVSFNQGVNILLNIFFGPAINAARGIAYQISNATNGFVSNFQTALNPQIVKNYATKNFSHMHQLVYSGSKVSFLLLYFICLPVLVETHSVLTWWLDEFPNYTVIFCRLVLVNALIDSISGPIGTAAQATGRIKKYQATIGILLILILPISYFLLKFGCPPQITLFVSIGMSIVALVVRLNIIFPLINMKINMFVKNVLIKICLVVLLSLPFPLVIHCLLDSSISRFVIIVFTSSLGILLSTYLAGLDNEEKRFVKTKILYRWGRTN